MLLKASVERASSLYWITSLVSFYALRRLMNVSINARYFSDSRSCEYLPPSKRTSLLFI